MQSQSATTQRHVDLTTMQAGGAQMASLMNSLPQAIAMVDLHLQYVLTSQKWNEYFNLGQVSPIGQSIQAQLAEFDAFPEVVQRGLDTATATQVETSRMLSGSVVDIQTWTITPWYGEDHCLAGLILMLDSQLPPLHPMPLIPGPPEPLVPETQQRLELIVQQMPIAVIEWNQDLRIVGWNPAAEKLFGYTQQEAIGQPINLMTPNYAKATVTQIAQKLLHQNHDHHDLEKNINDNITKDGQIITCEWHNTRLVNAKGELIGIASLAVNVSDRIQQENQLKEQEQFLRSIYDGVNCSIFVVDVTEDGEFLYNSYNQVAQTWTGRTNSQIAGKKPEEMFGLEEGLAVRKAFQRCVDYGNPLTEEEHLTFKDREVWLMSTFNPIRHVDGRIHRIVGTAFDITSLKKTQAALQFTLQEAEYQSYLLRTVMDTSPDWIFAKNQDFRYILVNQSLAQALGLSMVDMLGKTDMELGFADELIFGSPEKGIRGFRADDMRALAGEEVCNAFDPVTIADGSLRILDTRKIPLRDANGEIFAMLGVCRDLTDRHHAEEAVRQSEMQIKEKASQLEQTLQELTRTQAQLVQHEKMSSLGQLVAGVAHEINNPVNFIYGNLAHANTYTRDLLELVSLYQRHYPHPAPAIQTKAEEIDVQFLVEDLPKLLNSMKVGADRIQKIVASLRTFSRMDEAEMKAVNIHDGIDSTLMILQGRIKSRDSRNPIKIEQEYGNLPLIECYAGQLNQVFMNILSNAIDALEEVEETQDPGDESPTPRWQPTITIATEVFTPTEQISARSQVADSGSPSPCVCIRISDNGPGIPTHLQQRLFDPFFTTKPVGKGTGMGLSISYQIVAEKHGGRLLCESQPGVGTQFIVQIPLRQTANVMDAYR
ncbi:MAG: PAS domain-containing protein [Leptolyngbyaceae cyanobacterium bins.349]|nr:PAS domain-containing protein [Leptolyngbyaceae cyanobacterium bins.349]